LSAGALRVVGQRLDRPLEDGEPAGDEPACEAERAGDDVEGLLLHQNGKRVRSYAAEPGRTWPVMTTRGRWRTASAGCTSGLRPLKIGKRRVPSGDHSEYRMLTTSSGFTQWTGRIMIGGGSSGDASAASSTS